MSSSRTRLLLLLPLACLLLGTGLSVLLSMRTRENDADRLQAALRHSAVPIASAIQRVVGRHEEVIASIAALFYASEQVSNKEFREFTRDSLTSHSSIQALEWIPRVRHADREAFEQQVRAAGLAGFTIHQIAGDGQLEPASARADYFPVTFVEPAVGNEPALGFDLASEPTRRAALLEAMASGTSVASGPIRLVQETGEALGLLLFHPAYLGRRNAATPAERRAALTGFALGVFRVTDLVEEALRAAPSEGLHLRLRDETDPVQPLDLYESGGPAGASAAPARLFGSALEWSTSLRLPGRRWTVSFWPESTDTLGHGHPFSHAWQALAMGFTGTLLLSVSLWVLTRHSLRLEASAAELRRANQALGEESSERKRAQGALTHSHDLMRYVIEHSRSAIAVHDRELKYVYVSQRYLDEYGVKNQDVIGKHHYEVFPDLPQKWRDVHQRALAGEVLSAEDDPYEREDGSVDWTRWECRPWHEKDGSIGGIIVYTEVITERKRAEQALRNSEQRLRTVIDNADGVLWAIDANGVFTLSQGRGLEAIGLHTNEVVGRSLFEVYSDNPEVVAAARQALAGEPSAGVQQVAGQFFEARYFPTTDPEGAVTGATGVAVNITERIRAAKKLQESEARFREMAENIQEVFWLFDRTAQQIIYASPAYQVVWGRQIEDLYADYGEWGESIHPEDRAYAEESFARILESGGGTPREYRILRPNGGARWISDRAFPIRDEAGQIVRVAGIAEDITERKEMEEDRRRLESKMQHAQKLESLGVLAGGIAHDFNNLLMAILGNADLALLNLSPESPGRDNVEKIEQAAQRAAGLTNQMLAYSGKGRFVVQPIHLGRLVEEMTHLLETVISKKASLQFEFASEVPAIEADANQIRQVVMNLITNASEALEEKAGTVRVCTGVVHADRAYLSGCIFGETLEGGSYVFMEVSDTGCGMDEETCDRLFDPFFTTKFTGRGLGLAAVQGIVNGHHGAIKVYSEPQQGTTVKILFPASKAIPEPVPEVVERPQEEAGGALVLVVDDDPQVLEVAVQMLEHAGFTVRTAADGRDGVEVFRKHCDEIEVVVLDMTMPHVDGEEAFREIRRIRPDARVILSSGYNQQDATNRFAGKGLAGFIQKPYRSTRLLKKIYEALEQS